MSDARFWDTTFPVDIASTNDLIDVAALVYSPSNITVAKNLRGDQAQSLIDLVDRVSLFGFPICG